MIRQCLTMLLTSSLLGLCSPAIAGDFSSIRFTAARGHTRVMPGPANIFSVPGLPNFSARVGLPDSHAAFYIPPSDQQSNQPVQTQPLPQRGGWTKAGKILTVLGIGIAGGGAVMIAKGGTTTLASNQTTSVGIDWRTTGYVWVGVGAALALIGLTRRHH
jgi:hypothetical protein